MYFEYDPIKSAVNHDKHGIDFEAAQMLWEDDNAVLFTIVDLSDEERFMVIGKIKEKFWTAVITERDDNIRIISVRRARSKEIDAYEKQAHYR